MKDGDRHYTLGHFCGYCPWAEIFHRGCPALLGLTPKPKEAKPEEKKESNTKSYLDGNNIIQ